MHLLPNSVIVCFHSLTMHRIEMKQIILICEMLTIHLVVSEVFPLLFHHKLLIFLNVCNLIHYTHVSGHFETTCMDPERINRKLRWNNQVKYMNLTTYCVMLYHIRWIKLISSNIDKQRTSLQYHLIKCLDIEIYWFIPFNGC